MKYIKSTMLIVLFLLISLSAVAQDRIKLSVSYLNTEFQANPIDNLEYLRGVSIDADARIFSKSGFRLGGVFSYQRVYDQTILADYGEDHIDIRRDINTYSAGVQLSKRVGPIEPFGSFLLGTRKLSDGFTYEVVRKYRLGLDVPFHKESNFFVRPFFVEFEGTEGFASGTTHKYGSGLGFRF